MSNPGTVDSEGTNWRNCRTETKKRYHVTTTTRVFRNTLGAKQRKIHPNLHQHVDEGRSFTRIAMAGAL